MSDELTCPLCAQSEAMTLIPHLRQVHKIEPEVFRVRFPEQRLCTDGFASFLATRQVRKVDSALHYQLDVAGCLMTARYGVDHPLIPEPDPTFEMVKLPAPRAAPALPFAGKLVDPMT